MEGARRVEVAAGEGGGFGEVRRRADGGAGGRLRGGGGPPGGVGEVDDGDGGVGDRVAAGVEGDGGDGTDHGEVAVAASALLDREPGAAAGRREAHAGENLVGLQRRREVAE